MKELVIWVSEEKSMETIVFEGVDCREGYYKNIFYCCDYDEVFGTMKSIKEEFEDKYDSVVFRVD